MGERPPCKCGHAWDEHDEDGDCTQCLGKLQECDPVAPAKAALIAAVERLGEAGGMGPDLPLLMSRDMTPIFERAAALLENLTQPQPIATAPRDGREVLVWESERRPWRIATWTTVLGIVGWHSGPNLLFPTHWMPLPPGPGGDNER